MEEIKLDVQIRKQIGSRRVNAVRRIDSVPAVVYGEQKDPTTIQVDRRAYEKITRHHRGGNIIFHLNVLEGEKKLRDYAAIVKEEQLDPVSEKVLHIDFHRINLNKEIEVKVQVTTKGDPIGVKQDGGSLEHVLWELDVICLPKNIPTKIEIEVSSLKIGDAIHVKEITLPAGVRTKHNPDAILVTVVPPMKEEVAPAEGTPAPEVEVLKEKKKEPAPAAEGAKADAKGKAEGK